MLDDKCLNTETAGLLENGDMWDMVCPSNAKDSLVASDVESLETPDMGSIYGPSLTAVQQG